MVRSRLPVPSLLGLFGALLILSPELLKGVAGMPSDVPLTDPRVMEAVAYAVEQYNKEQGDSANYFKGLRLLKPLLPVDIWQEYHLMVAMVETTCRKQAREIMNYKRIQKCEQLPENPKKLTCYFNVSPPDGPSKMSLEVTVCT